MIDKTFVFGHTNPDTDSIVSAISMANLQTELGNNTQSCRLGNINKETAFALKTFDFEAPTLLEKIEDNSNVIMVDNNEFGQCVPGIENAKIKMVVDHHRFNLKTDEPVHCVTEPVGCTSTIIYKLYKQNDIDISPKMAGIMLSAIISDTLLFKSPTCTVEDKKIAEKLAKIADVDLYEYGERLLKAGTDISDYTADQIINIDSKPFDKNDIKFVISQINSADVDGVFTRKTELENSIGNEISKNNLNLYVFLVTDILKGDSKALVLGDKSNIFEKAFSVSLDNNTVLLKGVVSRKKQVLPKILENL